MPPPRHLPARIRTLGGRDSPESADLVRARTALDARERRLEESVLALDAYAWQLDRFRDGDNWIGGGYGGAWGPPADRSQDRSHAPLPYETEPEWRLHVAYVRDMLMRNHLALAARDLVCDFIGTVKVSWVERGEEPGASGGTSQSPIVREVNTAFKEFCEFTEWGEGEEDTQRECLQRVVGEGEATVRFFEGDDNSNHLPHLRIIDPEFIKTPTGASLNDPWGWGVKTRDRDAAGPEEGICVADTEDPTRMHAVESSEYVRTKINVDRVIKRGVSDFFPCSALFAKVLGIRESLAHNAELLAKLLWWEQFPTATETQVRSMIEAGRDYQRIKAVPGDTTRTTDVTAYERGSIVRTEAGRVVVPPPAAVNTPNLLSVDAAVIRGLGYRFGFPAYFTGESDASFASVLVTGSPFVRRITFRQHRAEAFNKKVAVRFVQFCERSGRLPRGTSQKVKPVTECEQVIIADEEKKSRVFLAEYNAGVASPQAYIRSKNDDPKQVAADIAEWKKANPPAGQQPPPGAPPAPGATDPTATPPGSAGGDGSSPNDDPMAGLLGESRISEGGFNGEITDSLGHKRHYQNGKQVKGPDDNPPERHADGSTKGDNPHPKAREAYRAVKDYLVANGSADPAELNEVVKDTGVSREHAEAFVDALFDRGLIQPGEGDSLRLHSHAGKAPAALSAVKDYLADHDTASPAELVEHLADTGMTRGAARRVLQDLHHTGALVKDGGQFKLAPATAKTEGRLSEEGQVTFPGRAGELLLLSESEYAELSEADRAGLVKKVITNRVGNKQTVWVRESAPGPPPRPGLVWNDATHRWRHPETGEEHEHPHDTADFTQTTLAHPPIQAAAASAEAFNDLLAQTGPGSRKERAGKLKDVAKQVQTEVATHFGPAAEEAAKALVTGGLTPDSAARVADRVKRAIANTFADRIADARDQLSRADSDTPVKVPPVTLADLVTAVHKTLEDVPRLAPDSGGVDHATVAAVERAFLGAEVSADHRGSAFSDLSQIANVNKWMRHQSGVRVPVSPGAAGEKPPTAPAPGETPAEPVLTPRAQRGLEAVAGNLDVGAAGLPALAQTNPVGVGGRLAAEWSRTPEGPDRESLGAYLAAVVLGAKMTHAPGDVVPFDGLGHEAKVGISTGAPARVTRPGWEIADGKGGRVVLLPAQVEPQSASRPATEETHPTAPKKMVKETVIHRAPDGTVIGATTTSREE